MNKVVAAFTQALPPPAAYSQLKNRARCERRMHIATALAALLVEGTLLIEEIPDRIFISRSMDVEG